MLALGLVAGLSTRASAQEQHAALAPEVTEREVITADLPDTPEVEQLVFGEDITLYDPSGQGLAPLHEALRRAQRGEDQARIVFYGASHVASDLFTHVVRSRLQERFGDAGHGFVMPGLPWRGYRHLGGVDVESPRNAWEGLRVRANSTDVDSLGVAGLAIEDSRPTAWGRIDATCPTGRFDLFYLQQPNGGSFDVKIDGRRVARIATAAAERAPGFAQYTVPEGTHQFEVHLRGDGPVRIFGSSVERETPGVIVDNMGLNGARAVSQLLWDEPIHQQYLRHLDPDLVVLAYGTNEAGDDNHPIEAYEAELRAVVARVRGTLPDAACMLIGPSDRPMRDDAREMVDRPRTAEIVEVQRRVSRDMGCVFFDLVSFGGGPLSMLQWAHTEPAFAQRDYVHFTARGYQRLGDVLTDAILRGME